MTAMGNASRQMHQRAAIVAMFGAALGTLSLVSLSDASLRSTSAITADYRAFCVASPSRVECARVAASKRAHSVVVGGADTRLAWDP
jgi:hypothetical protein